MNECAYVVISRGYECAYMVIRRRHRYMCPNDNSSHAEVQVFIAMFRFAIEQFIFCNKKTASLPGQARHHVCKTLLRH